MKFARSTSPSVPKKARFRAAAPAPAAEVPVRADLFDALDSFLTGLILERAPLDARTGLGDWLAVAERPAAPAAKRPARRRKPALAAA